MKPTKRMLYRLLYDALIEIRASEYEPGDKFVFVLADLFHHVPLQLDQLDRGELTVQDILRDPDVRARHHGIGDRLALRMRENAKYYPETMADEESAP